MEQLHVSPDLPPVRGRAERLPLSGLLALGTAGFVTVMTEALPAGVLPAMSADLGVSQSRAGQAVTLFALGSVVAAVPLTKATASWPRKRLLLTAICGFAVANAVTAFSTSYPVTMAARFLAGLVAGLLWALLAGYARGIVAPERRGRAMAIAMAGTPVALSVGVPAGTLLARLTGWRVTFGLMSVFALVLACWILRRLPDPPGRNGHAPAGSVGRVLRIAGVGAVLVVTAAFVLAHNILYTYVAALAAAAGIEDRVDAVLLVFGAFSLASIWITGALIDRHLRALLLVAVALFGAAALVLGLFTRSPWLLFTCASLWGLSFGGAATLLQTAVADAAADASDIAQSLLVTCWNAGIAGGAVVGGALLDRSGPQALPWTALALLVVCLTVTLTARRYAFPSRCAKDAGARRPDADR
ncbi:MFS transporter [Streptomyces sp. NPDC094032]|uniref:MFS transporter n=1 Tax=Streptomyces sp. NPDC094032 TaxID=3155308 RepID=UPI00331C0071